MALRALCFASGDSLNDGNYRTIPICLAASSQMQIGSSPFSNFRHRRSQSIMGTKQLKVEETVFGSPFFIHTRNCARCSPSLSQELGLRICWYSLWPPDFTVACSTHPTRNGWLQRLSGYSGMVFRAYAWVARNLFLASKKPELVCICLSAQRPQPA